MNELEKLREENEKLKKEIENLKNLRGQKQKEGMTLKAKRGKVMSKAAWGYKIERGILVRDEEVYREVQDLFKEFLEGEISLNKLSEKYGFSVNGIKKILSNFTYIGKVKFDGQIHEGNHEPIISATDFNHVQNKLDKISRKNKKLSL